MTKEQCGEEFCKRFPEKRKLLNEHYEDYGEFLSHVFFSETINYDLFPLLQINEQKQLIKQYCDFIEKMWSDGDDAIINVVDVTILERLSDEFVVWKNFREYISAEFIEYINEEVLVNNIAMLAVERL